MAENETQKKVIETLIAFYKTGDLERFDQYNILWVGDLASLVDRDSESYDAVVAAFPEARLLVVGEGSRHEALVEQAATIVTSNLDFDEWDQAFATNRLLAVNGLALDAAAAAQLVDFLLPAHL